MLTRELGTVGSTVVWASGLGTVSQKDLNLSKFTLRIHIGFFFTSTNIESQSRY